MKNKPFSHDFNKNMSADTSKREKAHRGPVRASSDVFFLTPQELIVLKAINPEKELQKFLDSEPE